MQQALSLEEHISTVHEGKKAFECESCDKSFSHKQTLKEHDNRVHLNVYPYKCTVCDYATVSKSDLNKHMKTHKQL